MCLMLILFWHTSLLMAWAMVACCSSVNSKDTDPKTTNSATYTSAVASMSSSVSRSIVLWPYKQNLSKSWMSSKKNNYFPSLLFISRNYNEIRRTHYSLKENCLIFCKINWRFYSVLRKLQGICLLRLLARSRVERCTYILTHSVQKAISMFSPPPSKLNDTCSAFYCPTLSVLNDLQDGGLGKGRSIVPKCVPRHPALPLGSDTHTGLPVSFTQTPDAPRNSGSALTELSYQQEHLEEDPPPGLLHPVPPRGPLKAPQPTLFINTIYTCTTQSTIVGRYVVFLHVFLSINLRLRCTCLPPLFPM